MFTTLFFNSLSKCFNLVGNTYKASIRVPLIKRTQDVKLYFNTQHMANLELSGFIKTSGEVYYNMDKDINNIEFLPNKEIEKITKRFRLVFEDAAYDPENDIAKIKIRSKLLLIRQEIIFRREYC